MEIVLGILGIGVLLVVAILYSSFAWGYVASVIYKWFLLSQFSELPIIEWWQFAGIMFFINCFVHTSDNSDIKEEYREDSIKRITTILIKPWFLLLGAWIFKVILF